MIGHVQVPDRKQFNYEKSISPTDSDAGYAVPYRSPAMIQQKSITSTDSDASQVTVIPAQRSVDSDVMYHVQAREGTHPNLSELDSQEFIDTERQNSERERPEPFLISREVLPVEDKLAKSPENRRSEANILDSNDVEFADASDTEEKDTEAMTPDEAENLLSSK